MINRELNAHLPERTPPMAEDIMRGVENQVVGPDPAFVGCADRAPAGLAASAHQSGVEEDESYREYDDEHCGNCGGEGFVYGCSWDWQCDTYDVGEGTCLCTRPCDWCGPRARSPELDAILAAALCDRDASLAEDAQRLSPEGVAARARRASPKIRRPTTRGGGSGGYLRPDPQI
jgi:hypothetical protein